MEVTLNSGNVSAVIDSFGAELKSLRVDGKELMWSADPAFWGKTSPILFPMIGTLKDGKTVINGKEYAIRRHGFVRDTELKPEKITPATAVFSMEQNDETRGMFPFDFRFAVQYTLKSDGITVTFTVTNNSAEKMPFCIGGHPAFAADGDFTEYALVFRQKETADVPLYNTQTGVYENESRTRIMSGDNVLPLKHELFYNDVLYFENPASRSVELLKGNHGVRVDFPDFTGLGVWQAKDAPFLCIEPWCGCQDYDTDSGVFAEKRGIETLESGESKAFTYCISRV
ncbi:MAG: aldose 1-epimerase family protein [Oscillospiraceae bacterium]